MKKPFHYLAGLSLFLGISQPTGGNAPTLAQPLAQSLIAQRALAQNNTAPNGIETLEDPLYWQDLCNVQMQAELFEEAQESCERVIALDPENETAWANYSSLLLTLEQYPKVLSAAGQLLAQNDQNSQAMTYQCLAHLGLNQLEPALEACNNALLANSFWEEMSPGLPLQTRGQILNKMGQYDQALIAYSQALQREPDDALTMAYRCQTLIELQQYDLAEATCNRAVNGNGQQPHQPPALALALLAEIYTYQGHQKLAPLGDITTAPDKVLAAIEAANEDYTKAIRFYGEAISLDPQNAAYFLQQGKLFERTDDFVSAGLTYGQYVALQPDSSKGLVAQCLLFNQQSQYDLAQAACEQAIAGNGDWKQREAAEARRGLAQAISSLGDYEAALPIIERAISMDDTLLAAKSDRIVILWYLEEYDDAINDTQEVLKNTQLTPENRFIIANTLATLGSIYSQQDNLNQAARWYERAIKLDHQNAETHVNLSAVFLRTAEVHTNATLKTDYYEEARKKASKATELDPLLLQGWKNLAIAQEKLGKDSTKSRERIQQLEEAQLEASQS